MARKKKKGCCSPHTKKGNEISTNATTKETWEILQEKIIIIKERKNSISLDM
jgi:hypothetical protein